jgi:transcriptional regulator with XRE-family HTH domain
MNPRAATASIDRHVGLRLRQRRIEMGLKQSAVAHTLGIASQQLGKYETGKNRLSAGRLFVAAAALEVPLAYFFEGLGGDLPVARSGHASRHAIEINRLLSLLPPATLAHVAGVMRALAAQPAQQEEAA